ncbi:MAG TPA: hypothetical protein VER55_03740, partial [Ardenticatenaceae bacterium]|nr:hypothetical protein [Ardenticatenaceae bacterium]
MDNTTVKKVADPLSAETSLSLRNVLDDPELLRVKTDRVYAQLTRLYGVRPLKARDPMRKLIGTVLSHRTRDEDTTTATNTLFERWPTLEALAAADVAEIEAAIGAVTFPEVKAPRIKRLLADIYAERGDYDLGFLAELPTPEALAWLTRLEGVGPKTATLVMLFVFHRPVLSVDTHVHRVSLRLGLIPPRTSAERAHKLLLDLFP